MHGFAVRLGTAQLASFRRLWCERGRYHRWLRSNLGMLECVHRKLRRGGGAAEPWGVLRLSTVCRRRIQRLASRGVTVWCNRPKHGPACRRSLRQSLSVVLEPQLPDESLRVLWVRKRMRNHLMRELLLLTALGCIGCFDARAGVHREPDPFVVCATDAECPSGMLCRHLSGIPGMFCARPCNSLVSQRCANGAACIRDEPLLQDFCAPGAGPNTNPPMPDGCTGYLYCPFGETCQGGSFTTGGTCQPACASDSECPAGDPCVFAGCGRVCDVRSSTSCPQHLGCSLDGVCESETAIAACPVGDNCPVGTICALGEDGRHFCYDRSTPPPLSPCAPDSQFFGPTGRCYPRSELRPVR